MNNKYSFENFILKCCGSTEWDLRKFLKRFLTNAGFQIQEDDYVSYRDGKYKTIRNMLAIRGNPRICLVAHTDVCRDHSDIFERATPVIKTITKADGSIQRIIQDKDCEVQVGGDDRLGVAINTWIALNTGYDLGLLFTTDEEVGLVSADYVRFPELMDFDLLVEVDRGNHSNQLVTNISGTQMCTGKTAQRLLRISEKIGLPRQTITGMITDVLAIKNRNRCKEAVNMTCGYHNSYGAQKNEYIDIQEAKDTMKYVANIVKDYDLEYIDDLAEGSEKNNKNKSFSHIKYDKNLWDESKYERDRAYFDEGYNGERRYLI